MFANTLTLTIDTVARTLIRTNQDNYGSVYQFEDGTEAIIMKIRHDTDNAGGKLNKRHNVLMERRIYGTPTSDERFVTVSMTMRKRDGTSPDVLLKSWQGLNTLLLTLDDGLVVGEN
jgi:hypothetical protein